MDFDLNSLWFVLIAVLFVGFFVLEGFDYGVGILLPFLGRDDRERRLIVNTIGPHWDGNEVWMITAGGAIFAAFPQWYATMFSGFYLALVVMLAALIVRGVAFEFRSKLESPKWRAIWDGAIFLGSLIPAFLWGVALSNIARGVPIDGSMKFVGTFFDLVSPYSLVAGLATVAIFTLHGAIFISLKTSGAVAERALTAARRLWLPAIIIIALFVVWSYASTDIFTRLGVNPGTPPVVAVLALLAIGLFIREKQMGWAFIASMVAIALSVVTVFSGLYPRVLPSNIAPEFSLTIYNAAASDYTLTIMSIVAILLVPVVLAYQAWTYWAFRKRLSTADKLEY
ncbi:MAG: cytochrome d ubiquinol oxidase subunit II [Candidatus Thermofonsia Clade 1 bacterium]|jgi:cytochrome d ubiquinol oxidase subunit II|uniref:Cytochrome d ubiquinol oxidase subunit II n=1 Tax=Candidatus Thermofonsia Clade 1 bacterium TaxID=2364210 RepID=A0A2M8PA24_9CHLR|nr:MAG: cytochrome d ubiquinol oxidase subunit II [Candidatus Thermofonsia Clade 1 bacterium]